MPQKSSRSQLPYLVFSTTSTKKEADHLGHILVREQRAACVNVVYPVESFFRWKGKVEKVREALLVIKTTLDQVPHIEKLIQKHHSYNVPEVIAWPIRRGTLNYLAWLKSCVKAD